MRAKSVRRKNSAAQERFVQDVREVIARIGTPAQIRDRFRGKMFSSLKASILPCFVKYLAKIEIERPIDFDHWAEENLPGLIEEIENAEDSCGES